MKKLIVILLFLIPCMVYSQTISYNIAWEKNDSMIYFSHAAYNDHHNLIPHYTKNIPWPHEGLLPKVKLTVNESSQVAQVYLENLDLTATGTSPQVTYELV